MVVLQWLCFCCTCILISALHFDIWNHFNGCRLSCLSSVVVVSTYVTLYLLTNCCILYRDLWLCSSRFFLTFLSRSCRTLSCYSTELSCVIFVLTIRLCGTFGCVLHSFLLSCSLCDVQVLIVISRLSCPS